MIISQHPAISKQNFNSLDIDIPRADNIMKTEEIIRIENKTHHV